MTKKQIKHKSYLLHKERIDNKCIVCKKIISHKAKKCSHCAKLGHKPTNIISPGAGKKGKMSFGYKHGKYCNPRYCIDCEKELSWKTNAIAIRCRSCANTGKLSPRFGKPNPHGGRGKRIYYKNICFRSSYEVAYAKYLDKNNIKWLYEPKIFNLGNMTYRPDFYLPKENIYIEIKGWLTEKAKEKMNLFKVLYPSVNLKMLNKPQLQTLRIL